MPKTSEVRDAPAVTAALSAEGLSAGFGDSPYINDLTLSVEPGEVLALLGANGAGKSTTLMALAGHLKPAAGRVLMFGEERTESMEQRVRNGVAVVTQERCVFMRLTARANLALGGGDIEEAVRLFPEIEPHLGRRTGLLSGGQQQILALARAMSTRPKILLVDEVTIGIAPLVAERLLDAIRTAADERGVAVVLVEQYAKRALKHSDTACVMRRGRMIMHDASSAMRSRLSEIERAYL